MHILSSANILLKMDENIFHLYHCRGKNGNPGQVSRFSMVRV